MPSSPIFQATLGEWRTILRSLSKYQEHLQAVLPQMQDEDGPTEEALVLYDHLERIHGLIPRLEQQIERSVKSPA